MSHGAGHTFCYTPTGEQEVWPFYYVKILNMEFVNQTSEQMSEDTLYTFYSYAVLPQFGIIDARVEWHSSEYMDGDEAVHFFGVDEQSYALIYEDYEGLGNNESFIRNNVLKEGQSFVFVEPESATAISPSYDGFRLPAPSQYSPNITGSYTLVKIDS